MVATDLSAKEINGACVFPSRPRPASRPERPDTYLRLPMKCRNSIAHRSRSIHRGYKAKLARRRFWSALPPIADIPAADFLYWARSGLAVSQLFSSLRDAYHTSVPSAPRELFCTADINWALPLSGRIYVAPRLSASCITRVADSKKEPNFASRDDLDPCGRE